MPILTHWKHYKKDETHMKEFMGKLSVRLAVDEKDKPTVEACSDILQKAVRQRRYLLKKKYFTDIPANQVRTTSPVSSLTDDQWLELVQMWSTAKAKATAAKYRLNHAKVRHHQKTGSRSCIPHLYAYRQKNKDREVDEVEMFKVCHTSDKTGMTDEVKETVSTMENMLAQPAQDMETARSSTEIVSKVLTQNSAASTFLKNAGIETSVSKSVASAAREAQLREQLQAEKERADHLQEELDTLKKKAADTEESMARTQEEVRRTQQEMEEFRKKQEANDLILQRILGLKSGTGP